MRKRSPTRLVQVLQRKVVSPNLLCLTFGGEALADFPTGAETATIKLLLPHAGQDWENYLLSLAGSGDKPLKRTYTILEFRADTCELDILFALHPNPGPATRWAQQANPGASIAFSGPGRVHRIDSDADWFLLVGDMSAQAAVCANIKLLPDTAQGYVLLETNDPVDQRDILLPDKVKLRWVTRPHQEPYSNALAEAVRCVDWLAGTPSIWIAGESEFVREMRTFLVNDRLVHRDHRHTSGYWQTGYTEDTHQLIKRNESRD